jgi:hypothetical protein
MEEETTWGKIARGLYKRYLNRILIEFASKISWFECKHSRCFSAGI